MPDPTPLSPLTTPPSSESATPKPLTFWQFKPWWCQPWSILLTGSGLIGGSWLIFHRYWLTGLVAVPIAAWMGLFLILVPRWAKTSGLLEELAAQKQKDG